MAVVQSCWHIKLTIIPALGAIYPRSCLPPHPIPKLPSPCPDFCFQFMLATLRPLIFSFLWLLKFTFLILDWISTLINSLGKPLTHFPKYSLLPPFLVNLLTYLSLFTPTLIFFLRFYLFIFRERAREGQKEGKKTLMWERNIEPVAFHTCPKQGLTHNPGICPGQELNQRPLALWVNAQPTEPPWSGRSNPHLFPPQN